MKTLQRLLYSLLFVLVSCYSVSAIEQPLILSDDSFDFNSRPSVSDTLVVWQAADFEGDVARMVIYDRLSNTHVVIAKENLSLKDPTVYGNFILYRGVEVTVTEPTDPKIAERIEKLENKLERVQDKKEKLKKEIKKAKAKKAKKVKKDKETKKKDLRTLLKKVVKQKIKFVRLSVKEKIIEKRLDKLEEKAGGDTTPGVVEGRENITLCFYDPLAKTCTETVLSENLYKAGAPSLHNNKFVWVEQVEETSPVNLMYCDFQAQTNCRTGQKVLLKELSSFSQVDLSANESVWNETPSGAQYPGIYLMDVEVPEDPVTIFQDANTINTNPQIHGATVIWEYRSADLSDYGIKYCKYDIFSMGCTGLKKVPLVPELPEKNRNLFMDVFQNAIVWQQAHIASNGVEVNDIFRYNIQGKKLEQMTSSIKTEAMPAIYFDTVAFEDERFDGNDVDVVILKDFVSAGVTSIGHWSSAGDGSCPGSIEALTNKTPFTTDPSFEFILQGAPANTTGLLYIAKEPDSQGFVHAGIEYFININGEIVNTIPFTTDGKGFAKVFFPLDGYEGGDQFYAQATFNNTESCGGADTLSASQALGVTVQDLF